MSSIDDAPHIGMVTWDFDDPKGGMGRSLQWIASSLAEGGEKIVTLSPGSPDARLLRWSRRLGGHLLFSLLLPFVLHRWVRRHRIDLLIVPVGPGGIFLLRHPPCPVVGIVYHTYAQQASAVPGESWKRIFLPLERRTLRRARRILCFAEDTRRVLLDRIGVPSDRVRLLPHAIDVEGWAFPRSEQQPFLAAVDPKRVALVVCVARLDRRKGVDVLLAAWEEVVHSHPSARLVLVGRGGSRRLRRMIRRSGSIEHISHLPLAALRSLLWRAAVAVCPSFLEGFGLAAAEAMAAGTAVVASDCDGLRSLIAYERTGLLVPPGDPASLARAILRLFDSETLRAQLGAAAKHEAGERFDEARASVQLREQIV